MFAKGLATRGERMRPAIKLKQSTFVPALCDIRLGTLPSWRDLHQTAVFFRILLK